MKRLGDRPQRILLGLALTLLTSAIQPSQTRAAGDSPAPLGILESTFRQGKTDRLRDLMGSGDKVYLSSPTLGFDNGYYSPDQVCLLLQESFRTRMTVRFNFLKGADVPREATRVVAVSRWTYRRGKSKEQTLELAFTLIRREGVWFLKEF